MTAVNSAGIADLRLADGAGIPPSAFGVTGTAGHAAEFPLRDFAGGGRPTSPGTPARPRRTRSSPSYRPPATARRTG